MNKEEIMLEFELNEENKKVIDFLKEEADKQYWYTIENEHGEQFDVVAKEKYDLLQQENKKIKERAIIMEKYLELISDLALDYDGCNSIESLKCLIDELKRFAMLGRVCNTTETIYINGNKAYNILHEEIKGDSNNE